MTTETSTPFVALGHFWSLRQLLADVPRELTITVTLDERHQWVFVEPGWRPISLTIEEEVLLLWSARNIHEFGPAGLRSTIFIDEDIEWALPLTSSGLLVICETSVRELRGGQEVKRIDFQDTFESVRRIEGAFVVKDATGDEYAIDVAND